MASGQSASRSSATAGLRASRRAARSSSPAGRSTRRSFCLPPCSGRPRSFSKSAARPGMLCRPSSRGEIKLRDPEGRLAPRIYARYLTDPDDWRIMMAAYRISKQIIATDPYKSLIEEQVRPGRDCVTDDQFLEYIRNTSSTVFHPCGTCRVGVDENAVVDPDLRVRGLDGLRVIDASIMPMVPSSNIHPATIMVAEKGADMLARSLKS